MKRCTIALFLMLTAVPVFSQEVHDGIVPGKQRQQPFFSVGTGFSYSVINNRKEIGGKYKPGINAHAALNISPWFAVTAGGNYFFLHAASPAFDRIHSWNTEVNCNFLMEIGNTNLFFKAIAGGGYMSWQGTYIGPSLNDNHTYYYGYVVNESWFCGNLGMGFSHNLGRRLSASGDFTLRFASENKDLFSISDTAFLLSIDWKLIRIKSDVDKNATLSHRKKPTGKGSGRLYKWLKKGA